MVTSIFNVRTSKNRQVQNGYVSQKNRFTALTMRYESEVANRNKYNQMEILSDEVFKFFSLVFKFNIDFIFL